MMISRNQLLYRQSHEFNFYQYQILISFLSFHFYFSNIQILQCSNNKWSIVYCLKDQILQQIQDQPGIYCLLLGMQLNILIFELYFQSNQINYPKFLNIHMFIKIDHLMLLSVHSLSYHLNSYLESHLMLKLFLIL